MEVSLFQSLLPYDLESRQIKFAASTLNETAFLCQIAEKTCSILETGDLEQIDPLVGDNACQIRALKIASIFKFLKTNIEPERATLRKTSDDIEAHLKEKIMSVNQLLKMSDPKISPHLLFFIRCHFLTIIKKIHPSKIESPLLPNESSDFNALQETKIPCASSLSGSFCVNLCHKLRKDLSWDSIEHMKGYGPIHEGHIKTDKLGLHHLSYFLSFKIFAIQMLALKIPVILRTELKNINDNYKTVNTTTLFMKVVNGNYIQASPTDEDRDEKAILIQGVTTGTMSDLIDYSSWNKKLMSYPLTKMLFNYGAAHRQFPDGTEPPEHEPDFEACRNEAEAAGHSLKNPSTFFLMHVSASSIGRFEESSALQSELPLESAAAGGVKPTGG